MGLLQWATVFLLLALIVGAQSFSGMAKSGGMARGKTGSVATLAKVVSGTLLAIAVALYVLVVLGIRPAGAIYLND